MFPDLFALLQREFGGGERVSAERYADIVDACWLCGRCQLRCPADLGISRQVMRMRLDARRAAPADSCRERHAEDWMLARPQEVGRISARVAPLANAILRSIPMRGLLERLTGIDRRAEPPRVQPRSFRRWFSARRSGGRLARGIAKKDRRNPRTSHQRRVAYFIGCHVDYYGASVGRAAVTVLEKCGVEVLCPDFRCCGMPQLAAADGARAGVNARFNIEKFSRLIESGYEIVTSCATCTLALTQHYPEFWPSVASEALAAHTWDVFSYLNSMCQRRQLPLDLRPLRRSVLYHYPCHARSQRYGNNVIDLLRLIPQLTVDYAAMACCGMGGTHGFKRRHYEQSQQQARKTMQFLEEAQPDCVVSDCPMCVHRIGKESGIQTVHPVELLSEASC